MYLGNFTVSRDKWTTIYEQYGIPRKNGYITTAERIKAKKKHRKK
jgi:hypothetical protein